MSETPGDGRGRRRGQGEPPAPEPRDAPAGADGSGCAPEAGALVVVTGYGEERLRYLAGLLGETLPRAVWASRAGAGPTDRELRRTLGHLRAGTSVIRVVEDEAQQRAYEALAGRASVRLLVLRVRAPHVSGARGGPAVEPGVERRVVREHLACGASLVTQLEQARAAWGRLHAASRRPV